MTARVRVAPAVALLGALAVALLLAALPAHARAADRPPSVLAPEAVLIEPATGDIVFARHADRRRPIASTTKIMTALVALRHLPLDDVISAAPYQAGAAESLLGIGAGQHLTVRDALRALLMVSANDIASTFAIRVAGTKAKFVRMMNAEARRIGLRNTHFANPVGLDNDENYGSAGDLVRLALVARENPVFRQTTNLAAATIKVDGQPRRITNRNLLVDDYGFVNGVKTGHTNSAGYILVGSATRNGVTVLSAVLGDPSEAARDADSLALLRYGLSKYRVATAVERGRVLAHATLHYRSGQATFVAGATLRRTIRRGERLRTHVVGQPTRVDGPLAQGARVGTVEIIQRGKVVARVPLVTQRAVSAATATQRLGDYLGRTVTILALVTFALCSLVLILLRRRVMARRTGPGEAEIA